MGSNILLSGRRLIGYDRKVTTDEATMAINGIPAELRSLKRDRAFWARFDVRGDAECWLWKSETQLTQSGYGTAFYGPIHTTAHRVAYMLKKGSIPDGQQVLHSCEKRYPAGSRTHRRCGNPDHLYAGTPQENMDDKVRNERQWRPPAYQDDRNPNARISTERLPEFFRDAETMSQRAMAAKYGISKSQVGNILRGESRPAALDSLSEDQRSGVIGAKAKRRKRF